MPDVVRCSRARLGRTRFLGGLAALLPLLASCADAPTETEEEPVEAASLSLADSDVDLWVGATHTPAVTARDAGGDVISATLQWSSSDTDVARVSAAGVVTAWGPGDATVTVTSGSAHADVAVAVTGLEEPIVGTLNEDFFYTNYVDEGSGTAIRDYTCGPKTYDGHQGVDIVLPSFARMDAGVDVVAAAPGTVVEAHDGEFDRQKAWSNAPWNDVIIDHDGQLRTVYGHLKSGSVAVTVGQSVAAGTKLGEVGSSGRSDMPHLHLELVQGGTFTDPYGGTCSSGRRYFLAPLPYQDEFRMIAAEVSDLAMDIDIIKDGLPPATTIDENDAQATAWVHLHNGRTGAQVVFTFRRPDGVALDDIDVTLPSFYSMSWWWAWWDRWLLDPWPGDWSVEIRYEGDLLATRTFLLEPPVNPGEAAARGEGVGYGSGGGVALGDLPGPIRRD